MNTKLFESPPVADFRLHRWQSPSELRAAAPAWDDLWLRHGQAAPLARAELVAHWLEHFAPRFPFVALAVEHQGSLVAALPLVGRRVKGLVELGSLPNNPWTGSGNLLVDPNCPDAALALLIEHLSQTPWPLLWLQGVNADSPAWQRLIGLATARGVEIEYQHLASVGWIDLPQDLPRYQAGLSKNLRKNLRRTAARLAERGPLALELYEQVAPAELPPLLRRAFDIEARSWKGPAGACVLRSPGVWEYFLGQAERLAQWNLLDISFLTMAGEAIAFEYGYRSHGVYFSHKVGYDETYAACGPGQLLMWELLKRFAADPRRRAIDCIAELSDAVGRWTTSTYQIGRLILAPAGIKSRLLLSAYRAWQRHKAGPRQAVENR